MLFLTLVNYYCCRLISFCIILSRDINKPLNYLRTIWHHLISKHVFSTLNPLTNPINTNRSIWLSTYRGHIFTNIQGYAIFSNIYKTNIQQKWPISWFLKIQNVVLQNTVSYFKINIWTYQKTSRFPQKVKTYYGRAKTVWYSLINDDSNDYYYYNLFNTKISIKKQVYISSPHWTEYESIKTKAKKYKPDSNSRTSVQKPMTYNS